MYERLYTAMVEHDVDTALCGVSVIYEEGQEYRDKESIEKYYTKEREGRYVVDINSMSYALVSVCIKMIKKSVLDTYDIRFIEGKTYEDNYFTFAYLAVANSMYFIRDKLYYRRLRSESITDLSIRGYTNSRIDLFYQLEHLFYFWVKHHRLSFEYVVYFWSYYISSLCDVVQSYPHISIEKLLPIVKRFVHRTKKSIPHIPELHELRVFLSYFVGYDV